MQGCNPRSMAAKSMGQHLSADSTSIENTFGLDSWNIDFIFTDVKQANKF